MLDLAAFLDEHLGVHSNYDAQIETIREQRQAKRKRNNEGRSLQRKTEVMLRAPVGKPMSKRRRRATTVAKLDDKKVFAIRELSMQGFSGVALAQQFGVAVKCIYNVVQRKTWAHV